MIALLALDDRREQEDAAGRGAENARWLAASDPLAVDDHPLWVDESDGEPPARPGDSPGIGERPEA